MQSNVTHTVNPPLGNTKMYNNSKVPSFYGQRMTTLLYINVVWSSSDELEKMYLLLYMYYLFLL